jgi:hypothetical protein
VKCEVEVQETVLIQRINGKEGFLWRRCRERARSATRHILHKTILGILTVTTGAWFSHWSVTSDESKATHVHTLLVRVLASEVIVEMGLMHSPWKQAY